jgi:hypothetical protein
MQVERTAARRADNFLLLIDNELDGVLTVRAIQPHGAALQRRFSQRLLFLTLTVRGQELFHPLPHFRRVIAAGFVEKGGLLLWPKVLCLGEKFLDSLLVSVGGHIQTELVPFDKTQAMSH